MRSAAAGWQDMFVYRDSDDDLRDYPEPDAEAAAEREAAYWYGPAEAVATERPPAEPARGPFEPIPQAAAATHDTVAGAGHETYGTSDADAEEPAAHHARKLEQIKDFYLTAEAIGEQNVDKHFDQLLAQQRELISEYFKQSATRKDESGLPRAEPSEAGVEPTEAGAPGIP